MERVRLTQFGFLCQGLVASTCFGVAGRLTLSLALFLFVSFSTRYAFVSNSMLSKIPSSVCNDVALAM